MARGGADPPVTQAWVNSRIQNELGVQTATMIQNIQVLENRVGKFENDVAGVIRQLNTGARDLQEQIDARVTTLLM